MQAMTPKDLQVLCVLLSVYTLQPEHALYSTYIMP